MLPLLFLQLTRPLVWRRALLLSSWINMYRINFLLCLPHVYSRTVKYGDDYQAFQLSNHHPQLSNICLIASPRSGGPSFGVTNLYILLLKGSPCHCPFCTWQAEQKGLPSPRPKKKVHGICVRAISFKQFMWLPVTKGLCLDSAAPLRQGWESLPPNQQTQGWWGQ